MNGLWSPSIIGDGSFPSRIGQDCRSARIDSRQAATDRPRRSGPLHLHHERIVAAGIENDNPQHCRLLDCGQHPIQRNGLVKHMGIALQLRIGRNQIIGAVDLDAMAGEENDRDLRAATLVSKSWSARRIAP